MNDLQIIKRECEMFFKLPTGSIDQRNRQKEIKTARQLAHFLAKERNGYTLAYIGKEIGRVDHATVLHSIRAVSTAISRDYRDRVLDAGMWAAVQRLRLRLEDRLTDNKMEWVNHIAQY